MGTLATLHVLRWPDGRYSVMGGTNYVKGLRGAPVVDVPVWVARDDAGEFGHLVHRFRRVGPADNPLNDCPPVEVYEYAGVAPPEAECP